MDSSTGAGGTRSSTGQRRSALALQDKALGSRSRSGPYPRLAFYITGTVEDGGASSMQRLLARLYSPGHSYLVHLDARVPQEERDRMAAWIIEQREARGWTGLEILNPPDLLNYPLGTDSADLVNNPPPPPDDSRSSDIKIPPTFVVFSPSLLLLNFQPPFSSSIPLSRSIHGP